MNTAYLKLMVVECKNDLNVSMKSTKNGRKTSFKKNEKVMMTSNLEISEIESVMRHTTGMLILNLVI